MTVPLLVVSNGNGEDDIACKVIDALRASPDCPQISAWPMVGPGQAYAVRGISIVGVQNTLPSEGFGTLSLKMFARDLRAGFIGTHLAQARFARDLRGQFPLMLAVGDIVPLAAGLLSRIPMAFISCAKSAYYGGSDGHTASERWLMRSRCRAVFPRDVLTAQRLTANRVPNTYLGNPMMDGLAPADPARFGIGAIVMLAGSRKDATENAAFLLQAAAGGQPGLRYLFPCHPSVDLARVAALSPDWVRADWDHPLTAPHLCLRARSGAKALLMGGAFADMLRAGRLAVGMAGTANEQALGLGLPLIVVPGAGNQGPAYVKMKMHWVGEAGLSVPRDPAAVAVAVAALLADAPRAAAMAQAGMRRMGDPGASAAIAARIHELLDSGDVP
jgi:uncharacterized protein (TIGR03492 family)